jgi:hypothetical protein
MSLVQSYAELKKCIVPTIGHELNREYIHVRLQTLENGEHLETQKFSRTYGLDYTNSIVGYFKQALNELK